MAQKDKRVLRALPSNVEAEQSVLGSMLISGDAADAIIPMLKAEDFYLAQNRTIFSVMKDLQEQGKPIDHVTVADALELHGKMGDVGGMDYILELTNILPSAANGEYYAQLIKRDALIRRVIEAGNKIAKEGYEATDGTNALEEAERLIYRIAEDASEKALLKADNALAQAYKSIQDAQSGNVPKNIVATDFPGLDSRTKGFKPGEFILVAARPSVGKTAFCLNVAANACLNHGKTVAIFSLEMPAEQLVKRMLANVSQVSMEAMETRGGLNTSEKARLYKAYKALLYTNLYIDDYSMNGPNDVLSKCRRLKREKGLDLVIVDYLQLMTGGSNGRSPESRQVEVSEMSRKMKIYAKELDVPIMVLSQMSRDVEKRKDDHEPKLSDLRESGSIEQDADVVMFIYRPSSFKPDWPEKQVVLAIKKNRNGPIGDVVLEWTGETQSFKECVDASAGVMSAPQNGERKEITHSDEGMTDASFAPNAAEQTVSEQNVRDDETRGSDGGFKNFKEISADGEELPFGNADADFNAEDFDTSGFGEDSTLSEEYEDDGDYEDYDGDYEYEDDSPSPDDNDAPPF